MHADGVSGLLFVIRRLQDQGKSLKQSLFDDLSPGLLMLALLTCSAIRLQEIEVSIPLTLDKVTIKLTLRAN